VSRLIIAAIRAYQVFLSPFLGQCCRFYPSCSSYCIMAVRRHGWVRGLRFGILRVCRCNPFHPGGVDPVPETEIGMKSGGVVDSLDAGYGAT